MNGSATVAGLGVAIGGITTAPRAYDNKSLIVAIEALLAHPSTTNIALARKLLKEVTT